MWEGGCSLYCDYYCNKTPKQPFKIVVTYYMYYMYSRVLFCVFLFNVSRYQLLLRDLVRYTEKGLDILSQQSGSMEGDLNNGGNGGSSSSASTDHLRVSLKNEVETLSRALHIMTIVPKMANDMMMVGRLQGFDVMIFLLLFLTFQRLRLFYFVHKRIQPISTLPASVCVLLSNALPFFLVVVQGKITAQGKLLLHGQLYCSTELGKQQQAAKEFKELQVFLFEQAIIFSEVVGKRTQFIQPVFIYKAHIQVLKLQFCIVLNSTRCPIYRLNLFKMSRFRLNLQMNKMSLDDKFEVGESGETLNFVVKSTDPRHANNATSSPSSSGSSSTSSASGGSGSGSGGSGAGGFGSHCAFVCHGLNAESTGEWVETIREILQKQRDFLKALQSPIKYQKYEQQRLSSSGHTTQHL